MRLALGWTELDIQASVESQRDSPKTSVGASWDLGECFCDVILDGKVFDYDLSIGNQDRHLTSFVDLQVGGAFLLGHAHIDHR
jgi:hypothetical protein